MIQPALWLGADTRTVHALMRSSEGCAYRSRSQDDGRSWSEAEPSSLPNNNASLAAVAVRVDGRHLVVCAHNPTSGDYAVRCPLVLSVSADDGEIWRTALVLDDGASPFPDDPGLRTDPPGPGSTLSPTDHGVATDGVGEHSYPALTTAGGVLHVTWTWQRRGVAHAELPIALLDHQPTTHLDTRRNP